MSTNEFSRTIGEHLNSALSQARQKRVVALENEAEQELRDRARKRRQLEAKPRIIEMIKEDSRSAANVLAGAGVYPGAEARKDRREYEFSRVPREGLLGWLGLKSYAKIQVPTFGVWVVREWTTTLASSWTGYGETIDTSTTVNHCLAITPSGELGHCTQNADHSWYWMEPRDQDLAPDEDIYTGDDYASIHAQPLVVQHREHLLALVDQVAGTHATLE